MPTACCGLGVSVDRVVQILTCRQHSTAPQQRDGLGPRQLPSSFHIHPPLPPSLLTSLPPDFFVADPKELLLLHGKIAALWRSDAGKVTN